MSDVYTQALRDILASTPAVSSKVNGQIKVNQTLAGQDQYLQDSFKSLISCELASINGDKYSTDLVLKADIRCRHSQEHASEIIETVKTVVDDDIASGAVHLYVSKTEGELAWSKPASAWRCELLITCTTNTPPTIDSLAVYPASPQVAEQEIQFVCLCTNDEHDELLYKFFLSGPATNNQSVEMTGWTTNNRWIWKPSILDTGSNTITAWVRDQRHAGPGSYDDEETASFSVTS
ncbi:Uncharacterised protein [uncultured archaeon]|nr:Uncharacterised protein [uncultured archaeon]